MFRRVGSAQDHPRMQESARLPGRGRSHREHGGLGAVRQRSQSLFDQSIARSRRPSKGTDTPGVLLHTLFSKTINEELSKTSSSLKNFNQF